MFKHIFIRMTYLFNRLTMNPVAFAKKIGVQVGEGCRFEGKNDFGTEPYLIKIGHRVSITSVTFLTHDGAVWLLRDKYPNCDLFGTITIGDNVFIGFNTVILPNVKVGSNVIIGAGSIVTKNIPDGEVWCGVPAKSLKTVDEYEKSVKDRLLYTKNLSKDEKVKVIRSNML